jgi:hypothetical protein
MVTGPTKFEPDSFAYPVPHTIPVPEVYWRALVETLQLGIAYAVGAALDPVAFARTVFAAIAPIPFVPMAPQEGADDEPFDTIACPLVDPDGLISWTGTVVAENAAVATSVKSAAKNFFMTYVLKLPSLRQRRTTQLIQRYG